MMKHAALLQAIEKHKAFDEAEQRIQQAFLQFLHNTPGELWASRNNLSGHLTASAWVVNKNRSKVLFAFHNLYNAWAWLGGHADDDLDLLHVAQKEAMEEAGLAQVTPVLIQPFDLSIDCVNAHIKKGVYVPSHVHFNVTFLLEADETAALQHRPDENAAVAWLHVDEIAEKSGEPHIIPTYNRIMAKVKMLSV